MSLGMTIELNAFLKSNKKDGNGNSNNMVSVYVFDIQSNIIFRVLYLIFALKI